MRITTDIEEGVLEEIMKATGLKSKSKAVAFAAQDFIKRTKAREFGKMLLEGEFDYPLTNDEIERYDTFPA
jgi:Arc/MetJ family transcription regulator